MFLHLIGLVSAGILLSGSYQILSRSKNAILRKSAWIFYLFLILLSVCYSGFRMTNSLETDEWRYRLSVAMALQNSLFNYIMENPTELLFQLLKWICGNLFKSSQALILISSILTQIPILEFFRRTSKNFTFAVFIYLCGGIFFITFIPINQYIAISLITYSVLFVKKHNFWPYYIAVIISTLFHSSSIILLPFPWLLYSKIKMWKVFFVGIIISLAGINFDVFFPLIANTQYAVYENYNRFFYGMSLSRAFFWVCQYLFTLYVYIKYEKNKSDLTQLIMWGATLSMGFYMAATQYVMFNRLEFFFGIMGISAVSSVTAYMKLNTKVVFLMLAIVTYLVYGYFVAFHTPNYFTVWSNNYLWVL